MTHSVSRHRHDSVGGEMAERCYAPLPPHLGPRFHIRPRGAHGPTRRLCTHPNHPQGASAPFTQVWALLRTPLGSSWGPSTGLARIRQIKHDLSHYQKPVAVARSNNYHMTHAGAVLLATIAFQGFWVKNLRACAHAHWRTHHLHRY